jgi:uncharacterized protein (DUF1499 family)
MTLLLKTAAVFAALAAVAAVVLACGAIIGNRVPVLAPPGPVERLRVYLSTNSARTRPRHEFPELRTRGYKLSRDETFDRIERVITEMGWKLQRTDRSDYTIDAVVSTPLLGFKDDVHVMLKSTADKGTLVDVASHSRVGRGDFGANIAHIVALYNALEAQS